MFIQDDPFSSYWTVINEGPASDRSTRQPPIWFIGHALKLSWTITIFQVFGMTRPGVEPVTFRSGSEHFTVTLPADRQ